MKISGIDFPTLLLSALRNDRLVIFAGAGVSIPQPAGLPTFRQLAEAVASGTGEELEEGESEDRFLGRLHYKGQQVHLQAAQEVQRNTPKPSGLHRDLIALFPGTDSLRVVTTNFDMLFEEAAQQQFQVQPEVFRAPALPLGGDFNGIVHVHGSIDSPQQMILTDSDFGRAYLAQGWARRFLVELFRTFTVLFVGYGHNDTVMNYLSRALPVDQTEPRFVLTDESDGNRWQILGIKPVFFTIGDANDYGALYKGVAGLSKYARRRILDWRSDIAEIAMNAPTLDEEAMDLIGESLSDPAHTRFFTEAAYHVEWVRWLDEKRHLESLFEVGPNIVLKETDRLLGLWLAQTFAQDHPDDMFRLIARHGMRLHPEFWQALGGSIATQKDTPWEPEIIGRWVSLLLVTAPSEPNEHILLWLGEHCIEGGLMDSLLEVFRKMSTTRLSLQDRPAFFGEDSVPSTTGEVATVCGHYELNQLWETGVKRNLEEIAEPLLDQVVDFFTTRHRTLCAWQGAQKDWDSYSFGRSAIEPHEQDAYPRTIDVLIDAGRDSLEHLVTAKPEIAANWCNRLGRSDVPVLRRLAVHALAFRGDLTPNAKIDWILDKIGLHDQMAHHELFRVMRAIYPDAEPKQREEVIDEVLKFVLPEQEGEDTARITAYQRFTWFSWLSDADPDCSLVRQRVEEILERYPTFKPREWADLTHYTTGGSVRHRSPWSAEELLASRARDWTERLLGFRGKDEFGEETEDRVGLLRALEEAVAQDFGWGLELADDLAQSGNWDSDLWRPLLHSWARQQGANEQGKVVDRLLQDELHGSHARIIADTLLALVSGGDMSCASGLLARADQVATTLWDKLDENEPVMSVEGWYGRAINHTAGILTQFYLGSMSAWYNELEPHPRRISEEYSAFLDKVVGDPTTAGRLGRSVIARELAFVMAVDQDWAIEHLLPLFEGETNDDRQAVWDGLFYGRLSPLVADTLGNAFLRTLSSMNELFGEATSSRELFIRTYTTFVAYFVDDPASSWIPTFFAQANMEDRRRFAWNLGVILGHMEAERQQDLWDRWLQTYWENRLLGTPAPLDPSEAGAMIDWLPELHCLFPAAVDITIQMQNPQLAHFRIGHHLNREEMGKRSPDATAKLLIYLAHCSLPLWSWHDAKELIEELIQSGLPQDLKDKLSEIPAKLGL